MSSGGEVIVEIPQGKLRGKKDTSVLGGEFYCFHRIPYAKPPVGELRFKAPQPADKWTGVLDATQEGPICPSADWSRTKYDKDCSEDSLFINVYCKQNPNAGGRKYPVMVWFHGGGFEFGSGNRNLAGPDYLMQHDIVLVTFNYRLGVLGFLSLQTAECPGNFGLKDQQLALRWVKSNIVLFGGDPNNITVFGISAGGASVHYQTLALSNNGLFHRAIVQSGVALNRWAFGKRPREYAFALGKRLGCDTNDDKVLLEFLRKAPAEDLVLKGLGVINEVEGECLGEWFLNFTFVPTVEPEHEGAFITKHPWYLLKEGKYLDVPMIIGATSDEMIPGVKSPDDYPRFTKVEDFQQLIPRDVPLVKNSPKALDLAKRIKEFYFKDGITLKSYIDMLSDSFFVYGVYKNVKSRTTNKNVRSPTYLYVFAYEGTQPLVKHILNLTSIEGSCHGDDVPYLFKTEFADVNKVRPGSRDYNFIQKLTTLWVNFAKTGVPTLLEPGFVWNETTPEGLEYLSIGDNLVMKTGFFKNRMEFCDGMYRSYYDH